MAGSINFRLSTSVLEWARKSMGYTIDEAAQKAGVDTPKYEAWETGEKLPTYKQLEKLAEQVFKRPIALLMLKTPPQESFIERDFRSVSNIELKNLTPDLRLALRKAKRYQSILEEVDVSNSKAKIFDFKIKNRELPFTAANNFRKFINLNISDQKSWKPDSGFGHFRTMIENLGVSVFLLRFSIDQARAFCISGNHPVIVLNQDDSKNEMIFSLIHELCHVIFNESDIFKDNPDRTSKDHKGTEDFCNEFAAAFLVPDVDFDNEIKSLHEAFDDRVIAKFSRLYNVSNEVIARKLLARKQITENYFWQRKSFWDSQARLTKQKEKDNRNPDDTTGINQGIKIVYEKGRSYVSKVVDSYVKGDLSGSDLSNYLETKIDHLPKILERLSK